MHGCESTWTWDPASQLRAWVAARDAEGAWPKDAPRAPKRMCHGCRDFVRAHKDREVACGKPDCERTWTYKTGAQLQDHLAGRTADPIKLCETCMKEQFVAGGGSSGLPEGAELMPCGVAGCEGKWVFVPGMTLAEAPADGSVLPDRMCNGCRAERGEAPRLDPALAEASSEPSEAAEPTDDASADAEAEAGSDAPETETETETETPDAGPDDGAN